MDSLAVGLLVFSISDCLYLYETALGSYTNGSPTDLGWVGGGLLLAWAAWQPAGEGATRTRRGLAAAGRARGIRPARARRAAVRPLPPREPVSLVLAGLSILAVLARLA